MFNLSAELNELTQQGLYRSCRVIESPQGVELIINGKNIINFCSNDYLGMANHPRLIEAYKAGLDKWGVGSGAAHLVCGHSSAHHALEEELAAFTGRERALLFSTGYMANLGVISALAGRGDTVFEDRLNHASLIDGALLSGAKLKRYTHADVGSLQELLINSTVNKLTVTDGVFSMDGDIAPLPELAALAKQHGAWLMVDDAHGLGVLGDQGRGTLAEFALGQNDVPILIGTFGKALGTFGAFAAGSEELIETLINKARTYIYTTAMPPALAEATRVSLKLVQAENWRRVKLNALITRFRSGAQQLGLPLAESRTPIQPLIIGDPEQTLNISNQLFNKGILIGAIRPPTVPKGSARLRITFSAAHEEKHIDYLLDALDQTVR
ncbi:MAG: 8-amino-7-oxononanoate synthase [Gammaproteobacteria bacterium]|nr:8-amino-7-oxononanoate synthase [Gammaproteobacteria bacterium]